MPSELDIFMSLPRHARRKVSRDQARALPIPPLPPRHGEIAAQVNAPRPMPHLIVTPRSGQLRINTKRNARAEFWRTVKVRVHPDLEQPFREHLHLLGDGARIQGRHKPMHAFAIDLDVHIPGAPAKAVQAMPVWRAVYEGRHKTAQLDHIAWYDADDKLIDVEAEQPVGATS